MHLGQLNNLLVHRPAYDGLSFRKHPYMLDLAPYLAVRPGLAAARHTVGVVQKKAILRIAVNHYKMPTDSKVPRSH